MALIDINSVENIGTGGIIKFNSDMAISGIILTNTDFKFDSIAELCNEQIWINAIKNKLIFPLFGLMGYEDQSIEPTFYEYKNKQRKLISIGERRLKFDFDFPFDSHKALQSYKNKDFRIILIDDSNKVIIFNDNEHYKGFSISMLIPDKIKITPADTASTAISSLFIDFSNYKEWDINSVFIIPSWSVLSLEPIYNVNLTVLSSNSSNITVKVSCNNGIYSNGLPICTNIAGISGSDFVLKTINGDTQTITVVDNYNGTYNLSGNLVSGNVSLVPLKDMVSNGILIDCLDVIDLTILNLPTVTTGEMTIEIGSNVFSGNVTSDGGDEITQRGFLLGLTADLNFGNADENYITTGSTGAYQMSDNTLNQGVLYYIRAYAINSVGVGYGSVTSFTTLVNISPPTVSTIGVENVSSHIVDITINILSQGGSNITSKGANWQLLSEPGDETGASSITYPPNIGQIILRGRYIGRTNALYKFQAFATNSYGTSYGEWIEFTTGA